MNKILIKKYEKMTIGQLQTMLDANEGHILYYMEKLEHINKDLWNPLNYDESSRCHGKLTVLFERIEIINRIIVKRFKDYKGLV